MTGPPILDLDLPDLALALDVEPLTPEPDDGRDGKTDAHLAQTIAVHVLAERARWAKGIGWSWLTDEGAVWRVVADEAVVDDARRFLLARYREAVDHRHALATELAGAEAELATAAATRDQTTEGTQT